MDKMNILYAFIGCIATIVAAVVIAHFALRYVYDYRITNNEIQILLFGLIAIRRIKIKDIDKIMKVSQLELAPSEVFSERWGNRIGRDVVMIRKVHGVSRDILIAPDSPDSFVGEVRIRMSSCPPVAQDLIDK